MTQPPKMSPLALQSPGMGMTLSTSSWSVGNCTLAGLRLVEGGFSLGVALGLADMGTIKVL
jgi:hypothetical protein